MIKGNLISKNFPYRNFWKQVAEYIKIINKCKVLPKLLHIKIGKFVETQWEYTPGVTKILDKNENRVCQYEKCFHSLEILHGKYNLMYGNIHFNNILQDYAGNIKFWGLECLDFLPCIYLPSEEYDGEQDPIELIANDHFVMAGEFLLHSTIEEQLEILKIYNKLGYINSSHTLSLIYDVKHHFIE